PLLWTLIDVTAARGLASTAEPTISITANGGGLGTVFEQGLGVNTTIGNPACGPGGLGPTLSIPDSYTPTVVMDLRPETSGTITVTGLMQSGLPPALVAEGFVAVWTVGPGAKRVVETFSFP